MQIEPQLKLFFRLAAAIGAKPFHQSTPEAIRIQDNAPDTVLTRFLKGKQYDVPHIDDRTVTTRHGQIPVRVYSQGFDQKRPLIFFIHGGGFVVGSINSYDHICRRIAHDTGHHLIVFEYHKAPEFPFPAAVDDCEDMLEWVYQHAKSFGWDGENISVMGDSAGGNLSAVMCQYVKNHPDRHFSHQVLIYPATDGSRDYPSAEEMAEAPILGKKDMDWFFEKYITDPDNEITDRRFSPLLADLSDHPPAYVLTAEYDPLRDQGKAYAEKLKSQGVPVVFRMFPRQPHGFLFFSGIATQATPVYADIVNFLNS